jgi:hypothetical protein
VTIVDVALRGIGDHWNDVILPGFNYYVVENTLGKDGTSVQCLTSLPVHAQELVGAKLWFAKIASGYKMGQMRLADRVSWTKSWRFCSFAFVRQHLPDQSIYLLKIHFRMIPPRSF